MLNLKRQLTEFFFGAPCKEELDAGHWDSVRQRLREGRQNLRSGHDSQPESERASIFSRRRERIEVLSAPEPDDHALQEALRFYRGFVKDFSAEACEQTM